MGFDVFDWYGAGSSETTVWPPAIEVSGGLELPHQWLARVLLEAAGWRGVARRPAGALVLGRFDPPHLGHAFLLQVAQQATKGALVVCVFSRPGDVVPSSGRAHAIRTMLPGTRVTVREEKVDEAFPSGAPEPERWAAWFSSTGLAGSVGLLVSSDPHAEAFAQAAGLELVLVDPARRTYPISSSAIRADPWATWDAIHPVCRGSFAKVVALVGPEGGGKTTAARRLAEHYGTSHSQEYLELVTRNLERPLRAQDLSKEGLTGQRESTESVRFRARRFGFVDSDALNVKLWHDRLFPSATPFELTPADWADHTLVFDDHPWTGDPKKDQPEARRRMVHDAVKALEANARSFTVIGGPIEQRLERAIASVDAWIATKPQLGRP